MCKSVCIHFAYGFICCSHQLVNIMSVQSQGVNRSVYYVLIIIIIIEHLLRRISLTVHQSSYRFTLIDMIINT